MKMTLHKMVASLALLFCLGKATAQVPATATWSLLTDQSVAVSGSITATSQALGPHLKGTQYNSSFGGVTGWQRVGSTSYLPVGYTDTSYVEYKVTPAGGKHFTLTSLEMAVLGGGTGTAKMAVMWSVNNFATSLPVGVCSYNGTTVSGTELDPISLLNTSTSSLTGQQILTIPTFITVTPAQTLSIRLYVWITGSGNRYLASQNFKLSGVTSDASLPLSLNSFSISSQDALNKLSWSTANETDMKGFEIQKSSTNNDFKTIGTVDAKNNSRNTYVFVDQEATAAKVTYYRLKMINKDGSFRYSFVITAVARVKNSIAVFPNPVSDVLNIKHPEAADNSILRVIAIDGSVLLSCEIPAGATQTSFITSNLQPGVYTIQYISHATVLNTRVVKQ